MYEAIDYVAIRACFELVYQSIFIGLEEKIIEHLEFNVQCGDIFADFRIEYENSNKKYNLIKPIIIFPLWNSIDDLSTQYTRKVYKF